MASLVPTTERAFVGWLQICVHSWRGVTWWGGLNRNAPSQHRGGQPSEAGCQLARFLPTIVCRTGVCLSLSASFGWTDFSFSCRRGHIGLGAHGIPAPPRLNEGHLQGPSSRRRHILSRYHGVGLPTYAVAGGHSLSYNSRFCAY